jgi:hypothetical protein
VPCTTQATQRLAQLPQDRLAARAAAVGISEVEVAEELGRENDAVAQPRTRGEKVADDLL